MSTTAQRKDISDPKVIQEFADTVALQSRLDYLYLLTICDIRSTNPTLLTDWKNALLRELYQSTRNYLQQSESASPSAHDLLIEKKNSAIKQLAEIEISAEDCQAFWNGMSTEYLLQHPVDLLVWHIAEIHQANTTKPIIRLKQDEKRSSTQVFIFAKTKKTLFTRIASSLEQMHMNIVAANLATNDDGYSLDTLTFLNTEGKPVTVLSDQQTILRTINKNLLSETFTTNPSHYRVPRKLKYFDTPTRVTFGQNETKKQTVLTLYTSDFPGLLTRISQVFYNEKLLIHSARISTLGEEVEDIFYITTLDNQQITDEQKQQQIRESLQERMQQLWK
jgi:[protein-PII] uridylyltransferase